MQCQGKLQVVNKAIVKFDDCDQVQICSFVKAQNIDKKTGDAKYLLCSFIPQKYLYLIS